jgi:hypothetical protein
MPGAIPRTVDPGRAEQDRWDLIKDHLAMEKL